MLCLMLLSSMMASCTPPIPSGGFDAPDPASRIYAAVEVATKFSRDRRRPDRSTLQDLVEMLLSTDPAERLVAGDTLRMVSGIDMGFDPSASIEKRAAAIDRWMEWVERLPEDPPSMEAS